MRADLRLAVPAAAGWVSLAVLIAFPSVVPVAAVACWAVAAVAIAISAGMHGRGRPLLTVALGAVVAAMLLSSAGVQEASRHPHAVTQAAEAGRMVTARASAAEAVSEGQRRFVVSAHSVQVGQTLHAVSIPILAFGAPDAEAGIGSELVLTGRLQPTDPADDVAFLMFLDGDAVVAAAPPWYLDWANDLRETFLAAALLLPGDGGALLPGLAIGDTTAVGDELDEAMKATALSHLTAVSGANCAVIVGLIMLGGAAFGLSRGWRVGASVVVLAGFVVLVTPEPSVLRAAVMAVLVLGALATGRPLSGLPVLSIAVVVLLAVDPWLSRSYGFVLSVLATAGLLLLAGPLARALARWIPLPLAVLISIPLAAQLVCQPVLVLLAPSIPTYGVIANILAGPAAPLATVLGLVACVLLPWLPAVGAFVASLAWLPAAWIAGVAMFFSGLPGDRLPWPAGAAGVALVIAVTALGLVATLLRAARFASLRRAASVTLVVLSVGYLGLVGGEEVRRRVTPPGDWQIAACDVGQGDAVLVRSVGSIALIDTGPDPAALEYCLDTLGIGRIDLVVLTHFDLDHVGGSAAVYGLVDRLMVGPSSGPDDDRIVRQLVEGGASVERGARGQRGLLGDLRWEVLWPPGGPGVSAGNDASVSLVFSGVGECPGGCLSSVFLGDLGEDAQNRLLGSNRLGPVDVVKVSHHGSRDQSARLYQTLDAVVGVIGVGAGNDYGHPTDDILRTLQATNTAVTRTDRNGLSLVSVKDGVVQLWTEHGGVSAPD